MSWQTVFVENPAKISSKNSQLVIETEKGKNLFPIEDVSVLLVENRQSSISAAVLSELGENGVTVYFCDKKHLPCCVLTPFATHSRNLRALKSQLAVSQPLRNRLWKSIVVSKIRNQVSCLEYCGKTTVAMKLRELSSKVKSDDRENIESATALVYFPALFGDNFIRRNDDVINTSLNYGYAILRGFIARTISTYGFHPAIGIHHRSELNPFNLADDLIEPFRSVVDLMVCSMEDFHTSQFSSDCKKILSACLSMEIKVENKKYSVSYAIEKFVQSLTTSFSQKENLLLLPELIPLRLHSYE